LQPLARVSGNEPGLWSRASDEALRESKLEQAAAGGRRAGGSRHPAVRVRDSLVVVLALTSGAIDAVTFVRLGTVFSSVITGNLALLGLAVGERQGGLAVNSGLALAAYAAGVLAGGALAGPLEGGQPVWPRRTTMTMAAELVVLAGFSAGWLAAGGHPSGAGRLALLALSAAAMGMQSAAVRLLGQMSTTYLTSTLIGILQSLAVRRAPQDWQRSTGVLIAFVAGAALGVAGAGASPALVPVAVMLPLAVVVLCAARSAPLRQPRDPAARGS
jgi:uncharacterized membrane protein YoaK (UPF0700 family)